MSNPLCLPHGAMSRLTRRKGRGVWLRNVNGKGLNTLKHDPNLYDIGNGMSIESMLVRISSESIAKHSKHLEQPVDRLVSATNHSHIMSVGIIQSIIGDDRTL